MLPQLDRRGLLFNARFAAGAAALSASMPGSEAWILSEGMSETREQLATVLRD